MALTILNEAKDSTIDSPEDLCTNRRTQLMGDKSREFKQCHSMARGPSRILGGLFVMTHSYCARRRLHAASRSVSVLSAKYETMDENLRNAVNCY
jgi:hypothetical protein